MSKTYSPQTGSLADRVCRWFATHPEEELTQSDIASKFDCNGPSVPALLTGALCAQLITRQRVRSDAEGMVSYTAYTAGPNLAAWATAQQVTSAMAAPKPRRSAATAPAAAVELDPSLIKVDDGIPLPKRIGGLTAGGRFDAVFQALQPGQSFEAPTPAAKRIYSNLGKWAKRYAPERKHSMRKVNDTHSRIWRTA